MRKVAFYMVSLFLSALLFTACNFEKEEDSESEMKSTIVYITGNASNCDFIYEIRNTTTVSFYVNNYIGIYYSDEGTQTDIAEEDKILLEANSAVQFKYNVAELLAKYPEYERSTFQIGMVAEYNGRDQVHGFQNPLNHKSSWKHTVVIYNDTPNQDPPYYLDGYNLYYY